MRRFLPTFLVITFVLALYPFLGKDLEPVGVGLPWDIAVLPDGSTKVLGLNPGKTTLGQAVARLGDDMELAVMAAAGQIGSLEMYYSRYQAGMLSARLILGADMDVESLNSMRANATATEVLKSGVRKYVVSEEDHEKAFSAVIETIAFIPATDLDHGIIIERFGEPDEVISEGKQTHYLYPEKGLDVILSDEGKEVLQYVAPSEFKRLRDPLGR